jgi:tetratricopeptide (TPR) repeat protein
VATKKRGKQPSSRDKSSSQLSSSSPSGRRWQLIVVGVAIALTIFAYSNAVRGKFVYDDNFQIVKNPLIQHSQYFWQAMTSDVWAFKGEREEARSNYWRPVFVALLALDYKLFGLDPTGWHFVNIIAHLLVTLLVYRMLVVLQLGPAICAAITWIFATHPAHVQSVTWISGAPDVLMSVFLLGSFLFYMRVRRRPSWFNRGAALALFAIALLSKEAAITFPAIIFLTEFTLSKGERKASKPALITAGKMCLPFLAGAVLFVLVRYLLIHVMRSLIPNAPGLATVLLTIPSMLLFYLKQIVFPFELGPHHGLRYVDSSNIAFANFLLPFVLIGSAAWAMAFLIRRNKAYSIGLIWFLMPLLPVLDARIFPPEMLVQDRYLYLPMIGLLIILAVGVSELASRFAPDKPLKIWSGKFPVTRAGLIACSIGLVLAITLAGMTRRYNPVWGDGIALYEHGVRVDPTSATAYSELGSEYQSAGRLADARAALTKALEIRPDLTSANTSMGVVARQERRYDEAERYLKRVLEVYPDNDVAREQLGLAYQEQGKLNEALALFDEGRRLMPYKADTYTVNIAVLHKLGNRDAEAQAELESLIPQLSSSTDPDVLKAWWYLGELYRQQGKASDSMIAYQQYLRATENIDSPQVRQLRQLASQALQRLKSGR